MATKARILSATKAAHRASAIAADSNGTYVLPGVGASTSTTAPTGHMSVVYSVGMNVLLDQS